TIIKGLAELLHQKGKHIITVATEHQAVLDPLIYLSTKGFEITTLPVAKSGLIDQDQFQNAIREDTIISIVMWANNETGVIQDMQALGSICQQKGITFISDATQAVGKIDVHPSASGVDMIVFSAHKFYGPKGVGAMWVGDKKKLKPIALLHGGGHEKGMRAGTMNVPGIVGMGKALDLATKRMKEETERLGFLRDELERKVLQEIEFAQVNGSTEHRLPTVSNLQIPYVDSQAVMTKFRSRLAISSGSACSSSDPTPSHVLLAMGLSSAQAKGSFRISVGMPTTPEETQKAATLLIDAIHAYRSESPVWQMVKQGIDVSGLV
ncbi:MAG: cysteine desulfurase family protein, partial [Saprospiraceae bacterium]